MRMNYRSHAILALVAACAAPTLWGANAAAQTCQGSLNECYSAHYWQETYAGLAGSGSRQWGTVPNRNPIALSGAMSGYFQGQVYVLGSQGHTCDGCPAGGQNYPVYRYSGDGGYIDHDYQNGEGLAWTPVASGRGYAVAISGAPDSLNHWVTNATGGIYKYFQSGDFYSPSKANGAMSCAYGQLAVGYNDDVWATSCDEPPGAPNAQQRHVYEGSGCGGKDANCTWTQKNMFDWVHGYQPALALDLAFESVACGVVGIRERFHRLGARR